ncbi:MAG: hypothetical protein ACI4JQ_00630 [Ruminococcus sp.]
MIDQKFLEGIGITDENMVKSITEAYAADIKAEQDKAAAVQTQLTEASEKLASFEEMDVDKIKQETADWKQKFEQAEADRKEKEYRDGVAAFVRKQGMKNDIYADHLTSQIIGKKLQFDESGILLGGDDVVKALRESCPDAFAPNPNERAAAPTSGHAPASMDGVERAFYAKNPDLMPKNV